MMLKIGPFECHENREVWNKGSQHNEEFNMVSIVSHAVLVMSLIHIHYFRLKQVCHLGYLEGAGTINPTDGYYLRT